MIAEIMVAVFLCKGSNLQVRSGIGCGMKTRKLNDCKTVSDIVSIRVRSLHRRIFQAALEGGFRGFLKYLSYFKVTFFRRRASQKNLFSD